MSKHLNFWVTTDVLAELFNKVGKKTDHLYYFCIKQAIYKCLTVLTNGNRNLEEVFSLLLLIW